MQANKHIPYGGEGAYATCACVGVVVVFVASGECLVR